MKTLKVLSLSLMATAFFISCNNDDDARPVNEEEIITTVTATLTAGDQIVTLISRDLDGAEGPNPPVVTVSGDFITNTVYSGSLSLLNESVTPVESITEEIEEEKEEHQFFYSVNNVLGNFAYAEPNDANGNPVGLNFTFTTGENPGTGVLTIILRHKPNKSAEGVASGNIANAGGETDIAVSFNINVLPE